MLAFQPASAFRGVFFSFVMALKRPWESNSWMFDFTEVQRGSWGFPYSSVGKESACNAGDLGSIPGLGRFPGEGKGYPLQCSGLENSMDCP